MDINKQLKRLLPILAGVLAVLILVLVIILSMKPETPSAGGTSEDPSSSSTGSGAEPPASSSVPESSTALPAPYRHPLTGVPLYDPCLQRPVAVMLNNHKPAMPQHGICQADILYEVLAEGGITRCMAIFTNVADVENLGAVRSARKYFVDIARGYDAAYAHAGGSPEALEYLETLKGMNLEGGMTATHFYWDQDRINKGYPKDCSYFTTGPLLLDYAASRNVATTLAAEKSYGMLFDEEAAFEGEAGAKVTVYFNQGGNPGTYTKSTTLTYSEQTGTYYAVQHGGDYVDGNTGNEVSFRNVVVLRAATTLQSDKLHLTIETVGSGTGYFACNGQMIPINWSRASETEPFTYTMEDGTPVTFGVGSSYIAVVPTNATVNFE